MLSEIQTFVNWVRRRNPQARTHKDYQYDLTQFLAVVGDRPLREITFQDIDQFIDQQVARGLQPATVNRRLAAIMSLYFFWVAEDPALVCPVLPRRHLLRTPQRLPRPVPVADVEQFFAVIESPRDRAMFVLMLRGGLRIGEVAALRMIDLYLQAQPPRVQVRGKGSRERTVYLSPQAEQCLRAYLRQRPEAAADHVFLSYQHAGLSTTAIHKRLMRYRQQAGVQLTAHQLRHTFAHDLLDAGVPVTTIQKLLGHRWLETTQTYVAANDKMVQADFDAACQHLEGWS